MHRSRLLLVVSAVLGFLALLLPFVRLAQQGITNGFDGYAWPVTVLLGALAVLAALGDRAESLRPTLAIGAVTVAGGATVLAAFKLSDAAQAADVPGASLGAGPWVLLASCVLAMAGALASLTRRI